MFSSDSIPAALQTKDGTEPCHCLFLDTGQNRPDRPAPVTRVSSGWFSDCRSHEGVPTVKTLRVFYVIMAMLMLFALAPMQSASATPSQAVPSAPTLVSPSNALLPEPVGWRPTLKWKFVTGAESYELQVATSSSFSTIVFPSAAPFLNVGNVLEFTPDGDLPGNKKLYWRVRAVNADGAGKWSTARYFYTRPHPVSSGFGVEPSLPLVPPATDVTVAAMRPILSWDRSENVTKYTLHVATDASFKKIKINKTISVSASLALVSYEVTSDLLPGIQYWWRVQARGSFGANSAYSAVQTFFTPIDPPKVPVQVAPLNKTVAVYNPALVWKPVVAGAGRTIEYHIQLSTSSKFSVITRDYMSITGDPVTGSTNLSFTIPEELPAGTYYWRIRAVDDRGVIGNWSKSYYFKTPATIQLTVIDAALYSIGTTQPLEGVNVTISGVTPTAYVSGEDPIVIRFVSSGSHTVSLTSPDFLNYKKTESISAGKLYNLVYQFKRRPIRLELTWAKTPTDLDMHLWLPQDYLQYHVYPDRRGSTTKVPWAYISKDVFGTATTKTETLTIQQRFPGVYTFAVFNFSRDGKWETSGTEKTLAGTNKGARVIMYKLDAAGKVWQRYGDPVYVVKDGVTEYQGKWWHVFDIDGTTGEITGTPPTVLNVVQIDSPGQYDQLGGTALEPK